MIARIVAVVTLVALALQPALALGVTASTSFGPPTIRLEASDTLLAVRTAMVQLPRGETPIALPLAGLGVAVADVTLKVMPADSVRLAAVTTGPEGTRWVLEATRECEATLALTYPVKGLSWALAYTGTLGIDGSLDFSAALTVTNGVGRDLQDARLIGEFARAELSLENGQSVTLDQPWLDAMIARDDVSRSFVYDRVGVGDTPVEVLTIAADAPARATALPAGTLRIYASPEAGGEFLTQTSIAYAPPREAIELTLGPAPGIAVTRTLDATKEVDKRLDAQNRVVLFDLLETWVLEVRNLRTEPIELRVRERHEGAWKLESSSVELMREDAETLEFTLPVAPDERSEVTFVLRHQNKQP